MAINKCPVCGKNWFAILCHKHYYGAFTESGIITAEDNDSKYEFTVGCFYCNYQCDSEGKDCYKVKITLIINDT